MTSSHIASPSRIRGTSHYDTDSADRSVEPLAGPPAPVEKHFVDIIETERRRLGREFHDGLGQRLTTLALSAAILSQKLETANRPELADARRLVMQIDEAVREARSLVRGLYPAWLVQNGLETTLGDLLTRTQDVSGRATEFIVGANWIPVTNREDAMHIFRVVQEAVNNALKHSGCEKITVTLEESDGRRRVIIADDGRGIPESATSGFGLRLMHYRASLLGGRLTISALPAGGTVVELILDGVDMSD